MEVFSTCWVTVLTLLLLVIRAELTEQTVSDEISDVEVNSVTSSRSADDIRYKLMCTDLIGAGELKVTSDKYIHLASILVNVSSDLVSGIMAVFKHLLHSLFSSSKGTPLHIILITDEKSKDKVETAVVQAIGKYLSESVIRWVHLPKGQAQALTFPDVFVEFVNIESITDPHREAIDMMKSLYTTAPEANHKIGESEGRVMVISKKYHQDLFVIAPFYPAAFTKLDRLVVVDADVEIREDLSQLNQLFPETNGPEVMSVSLDQSGYYWYMKEYLTQKLGLLQDIVDKPIIRGLNTGVVLYNLEKMRQDETYQEQLKSENYEKLLKSYGINKMMVGDQDWLTLLIWTYPHLAKVLPCEYNVQKALHDFHKYPCPEPHKILHVHGRIENQEQRRD